MANWAKQSLFASSLHWPRVILNRLLLGQRGPFLIFWKVGSWHFMAVFLFFLSLQLYVKSKERRGTSEARESHWRSREG